VKRTLGVLGGAICTMLLVACAPPQPRNAAEPVDGLRSTAMVAAPLNLSISLLTSKKAEGTLVIYVHGTPGEAEGWIDYVLEPVTGTRSRALDRPGFGKTHPDTAVTSLATQAAAVVALFPQGAEKVVLVGHSLGGAVVARVAADHPGRVSGLVLLAASLDPAQESINPLQPIGQMWPIKVMLPRMLRNANDELMAFKQELLLLQPMLDRIQAPTMIVHGTQDDLVPFANVAYMRAHFTRAQCVKTRVLEGVNHFLPWNSEPVVREAIAWAALPICAGA
jgi:pimeloyl-ACP methyl ester carboxylesterase